MTLRSVFQAIDGIKLLAWVKLVIKPVKTSFAIQSNLFLLAAIFLVSIPALAQFTFTTNNGAITITGYTGSGGNVIIPSTTNGYPVTTIGTGAFSNNTSVTSVTIPNTVTNGGDYAFCSCSKLTSATINSRITGRREFQFCNNLANVVISTNVTVIADECFEFGNSLTNIVIPNSVTNIGLNVFYADYGIKSILIGTNVTVIGGGAFEICGMTNITIPASVNSIGSVAFAACKNLTAINVDPNNPLYESVNGVLFTKDLTQLLAFPSGIAGSYTIPNRTVRIDDSAFCNCSGLTSVIFPNSVTSISAAFYYCQGLTSVTIPGSVTSIEQFAFSICTNLHQAFFQGNAPSVSATGGPGNPDNTVFWGESGTVYYVPGTTGWSTNFGGWPTAQWYQPQPQIFGSGNGLGLRSNGFQFTISWATNTAVVVEASTNLQNWTPVITNLLVNGTNAFGDSTWTNYPQRFYRVRSQ
jgi:hypothetical protein